MPFDPITQSIAPSGAFKSKESDIAPPSIASDQTSVASAASPSNWQPRHSRCRMPKLQGSPLGVNAAVPSAIETSANNAASVLRTLVLCDLVDSTALVERLGDRHAADLFRKHDRLARALMQQHGGQEIDKTDGFLLLFERPIQAVAFALDYQRDLAALGAQEQAPLAARIGIHIGDVVIWDNVADDVRRGAKQTEVEGLAKPVTARLMSLALPGQILLSGSAFEIAHRAQGELGDKLGLVRWRTHGRYRFKGVPDLVPVFEVGEEGLAPLKPPPWSGKAHREMPIWRRPLLVGFEVAALALAIAIPVFYLSRPEPAIAFANRDWVVVGDLKNLTGEKVFDNSLQTAFRIGLEQSRYVNVVPQLQVRDALKRMERDPAKTPVDRAIGSEVALREGARALVLPTIAEIGGRVRLTAEVIDPKTQTSVYSDSVDGSGEESVLPSMDSLLKKMRGRLGESMASIGEASAPLAQATTANLEALKAYSLGVGAVEGGKGVDAISLFDQAISLDPNFSQAYLDLANIYNALSQRAKAHQYVLLANRNLDRLSAREKLRAEGYAAFFATPADMREKWSLYAKLYPDAMTGQQNLGVVMWWYDNELKQAAKELQEVADSHHPRRGYAWLALGDIQVASGQPEQAKKSYLMARQVGAPQLYLDPINLFVATRDFAGAEAALQKEDTHHFPPFEIEKKMREAALGVSRGQFKAAQTAAASAAHIADQSKLEVPRARARLAELAIGFATDDPKASDDLRSYVSEELRRSTRATENYDFSSYVNLSLAAMLALRHNEHNLAEHVLSTLRPVVEKSGYFNVQQAYKIAACEAEIEHDAASAISCLEGLLSDRAYFQTRVALLRAYLAAGENTKALAAAQWLASHRGEATAEWLDQFAAQTLNLIGSDEALLDAAQLQQKGGHDAEASKLLMQFNNGWAHSEGNPPLLRRARAIQASLGGLHKED